MIPLTTLYDEYIDRSKLTEQKNLFEYIVPPPSRGVRTSNCRMKFPHHDHMYFYQQLRRNVFFLFQVCVDEWDLFQHFFSHPTERLASFLQSLCNHLYDALRPLIVHIVHLETLSELCTILKSGSFFFELSQNKWSCEVLCGGTESPDIRFNK